MNQDTPYLITTRLNEARPPQDAKTIVLGDWCTPLPYSVDPSRHESLPYHWLEPGRMKSDYAEIKKTQETLLGDLAEQLNKIHGTQFSLRFWRILIGPWLGYFSQAIWDRWLSINEAVSKYPELISRHTNFPQEKLIPNDIRHFLNISQTDVWNDQMYRQIAELRGISTELVPFKGEWSISSKRKTKLTLRGLARMAKVGFKDAISKLTSSSKDTDAFFIGTYFPDSLERSLLKELGQTSAKRKFHLPHQTDFEPSKRQWKLPQSDDDFAQFLRELIPKHIPTAYLEGFSGMADVVNKVNWPERPRFIFTSSSINSDDVFKFWCAHKCENNTPLIIGQHGGHYGIADWSFSLDHQLEVCDEFLSWGWTDPNQSKIRPIGKFQPGRVRSTKKSRSKLVLVTMCLERFNRLMYATFSSGTWGEYTADQFRFIENLSKPTQKNLHLRLYGNDFGWKQKERYQARFDWIQCDTGEYPMARLQDEAKIFVSTYNATTFLESLSSNIPTVMYWNPARWELSESAKVHFDRFKRLGLFHESPEEASEHINSIWTDVDTWWNQTEVQDARKKFCDLYAYTPDDIADRLLKYFNQL